MIRNRLTDIPQILLLRSDKILFATIDSFLKDIDFNDSFDEVFDGIRDFYPNNYRLDEMESALSQESIKLSGIDSDYDYKYFYGKDYNFTFLDELFDRFYEQNGVNIHVKDTQIEEYLAFINKISPFCLVGYYLSKEYIKGNINIYSILSYADAYTPLALHIDKLSPYAENHLHLKGAGYLAFNFLNLMSYKTPDIFYKKTFLKELPRINEFSYINNYTFSIGQIVDILKWSQKYIFSYILSGDNELYQNGNELEKIIKINKNVTSHKGFNLEHFTQLIKIMPLGYKDDIQKLFYEMVKYYEKDEYNRACLIESIIIFYLHETSNNISLKRVIKIFIHTLNILRTYMTMSQNLGLAHFSEYNRSPIRQIEKKDTCNSVSSIIKSGTTHLNAKIGILNSANEIAQRVEEFIDIFETKISKDGKLKFNFTLSAIKGREEDISDRYLNILKPRFYHKRLSLKTQTLALDKFLRSIQYKIINRHKMKLKYHFQDAYINKKQDLNMFYDLSRYIVAIDAVGKETHTPPEVFAPYFRYLRNPPRILKDHIYPFYTKIPHHPNLIFSVHAGEDFNHIVTGMRRVDEVLIYYDMKQRDRLGHLLSLGITPQKWIENTQQIIVTKGDYLDDLVWLVMKLKELPSVNTNIYKFIHLYTDRIWELFREIYSNYKYKQPKLKDLYDAWLYRKNCPINYFRRERGEYLISEYDKRVLDKKPSKIVHRLFELYHTDGAVRKKYNEQYKFLSREIPDDELEVWEMVQDHLINDIGKRGIIVETNPSSNLFISRMRSYTDHPIFRFNPPKEKYLQKGECFNKYGIREGNIAVTINSDDPSIFVTSLQNEYRAIRSILKERYSCTDKEAERYIEDIRKFSIKIFEECYYQT